MVKILLLKTTPEGSVYSQFVNSLNRALVELGHQSTVSDQSVHVVDNRAPAKHLVEALIADRPEAVLSFSSIFASLVLDDQRSLFDALDVKFLSWLLDHPIYAPQSLRRELKGRYAVYSNSSHQRFAQAYNVPGQAMTMLPGGERARTEKSYRAREWPLFIAASWNGPPERFWDDSDQSMATRLLVGVIDRLLSDRRASLIDAFNSVCAELKIEIPLGQDPAIDEQMRSFLCGALTYVRRLDRYNLTMALAKAGVPMTICGSGWGQVLGDLGNVTCIDSVPFRKLPDLYANSQVVLNLNAGNGGSERAIQAAFCGAAVASDYSHELDALFGASAGVVFYNRAEPDTAVEAVTNLLETSGEAVAECGRQRVEESSDWRRRAEKIVEFLRC